MEGQLTSPPRHLDFYEYRCRGGVLTASTQTLYNRQLRGLTRIACRSGRRDGGERSVSNRASAAMSQSSSVTSRSARVASDNAKVAGQRLGKFRMIRRLGVGGMGAVYLAEDTEKNRVVAVKVLPRDRAANNPTLVKRFKAEAQAAARLDHDHIVRVYEAGEVSGYLYIALEYIDGIDVHELVRRKGVLPIRRTIDIVRQVAGALEHAYQRNIVHRDIKPSNLLIQRDGTVKLADLGLARAVDETANTSITRAGTTVGTVDYMAPEQAHNSKAADTRSDIYSLGCTWYHMLTGQPPFPEGSLINKITAHATQPPPDPRKLNPAVPESVVRVMHKMMAKRPEDRYQTPAELIAAIDDVLRQQKAQRRSSAKAADERALEQMAAEALQEAERERAAEAQTQPEAAAENTAEEFEFVPRSGGRTVTGPPPARRRKRAAPRKHGPAWMPWAVGAGAAALFVLLAIVLWPGGRTETADGQTGSVSPPATEKSGADTASSDGSASSKSGGRHPETPAVVRNEGTGTTTHGGEGPSRKKPASSGGQGDGSPRGRTPAGDLRRITAAFAFPWRGAGLPSLSAWDGSASAIEPDWWKRASTGRSAVPTAVGDDFTEFTSLNAAVRRADAPDVVLQLSGQGPYRLDADDWSRRRSVAIRSRSMKDVLVDLSKLDGVQGLRLGDCSLVFENVRLWLVPPRRRAAGEGVPAVFSSRGSDIAFVHCSIQLLEPSSVPCVLCRFEGGQRGDKAASSAAADKARRAQGSAGRLLFERSAVVCPGLGVLSVRSRPVAVAAARSLLLVPGATALSVHSSEPAGAALFDVRLFCTTVLAGRKFCALAVDRMPGGLSIATHASVLVSQEPQSELVSAAQWPVNQITEPGRTRLLRAVWRAERTVLAGWQRLLTTSPFTTESSPTSESWKLIWGRAEGVRFVSAADSKAWRPDVPIEDWSAVTGLPGWTQGDVGCATSELPPIDRLGLVRTRRYRQRLLPEGTRFGPGSPRVEVDLSRTPLEEAIAARSWADGTVFVVRGSGRHRVRPIAIEGRSARIECVSKDPDDPLVLVPSAARGGGAGQEAMFTVRAAHLEIRGATIQFPAAFRADGTPSRWLLVEGGSFRAEACRVFGPTVDGVGFDALIEWRSGTAEPSDGRRRRRGVLRDCYLIGRCRLLDAQIRGRDLLIHNTLLVSDDAAVIADLRGLSADVDATIEAVQTTFAAARAFSVKSLRVGERGRRPCRMIVIRSLFAPPPADVASGDAFALFTPQGAIARKQIAWFGDTNAFASGVVPLRTDAAEVPSGDPLSVWKQLWGPDAVLTPLWGADVVRWAGRPQMKARPPADRFTLDPACPAAVSGVGGGPVGCDPTRWPRPEPPPDDAVTRR
ncbi:MAG: serine/threonine protein kinase [Planctomycetota bacterium]|nr:MAG: serine/threonine protein kinase [Planctomycetota bacterium]